MDPDDYIPLSALQHFLYCPRQCALIHLEQLWAESRHTAEGRLLHERADRPKGERRRGVRTVTAMPLSHAELGITGIADVVEFHAGDAGEQPYPVEYKRGRPKAHRADEAQLCAQALCLEDMTGQDIPEGALFYGQRRRRTIVPFDAELRALVATITAEIRACLASGILPAPIYDPARCEACSLNGLCRPQMARHDCDAWLSRRLARAGVPE